MGRAMDLRPADWIRGRRQGDGGAPEGRAPGAGFPADAETHAAGGAPRGREKAFRKSGKMVGFTGKMVLSEKRIKAIFGF